MAYFQKMGNVWYNVSGSKILINDITAFAALSDTWKQDARVQIPYSVRDGELPHQISYRLYGSVDYWWTILLLNNIFDFDNQWPRNYEQLNDYIDRKYPGKLRTDVHHYINSQGLIADLLGTRLDMGLASTTPDATVIDVANLEVISIEEFEIAVNESKRQISLVDPDYITTVQLEFDKAMQPEV